MSKGKPKITILIPTKDEGEGLEKIIVSVRPYAWEIIVVDGHSKDNTKEICRRQKVRHVLDHGLGRGDGVRMGLRSAKGEIVVMVDADGSHDVRDIPRLIAPILEGRADLVVGSRRLGGSFDLDMSMYGVVRSAGADLLTSLVNHKFRTDLSDILYSFRAIRRDAIPMLKLNSNDFEIDQEMVVKCLKKGLKVGQVPTREKKRAWGQSKLRTITGVKLFFNLVLRLYFN